MEFVKTQGGPRWLLQCQCILYKFPEVTEMLNCLLKLCLDYIGSVWRSRLTQKKSLLTSRSTEQLRAQFRSARPRGGWGSPSRGAPPAWPSSRSGRGGSGPRRPREPQPGRAAFEGKLSRISGKVEKFWSKVGKFWQILQWKNWDCRFCYSSQRCNLMQFVLCKIC